MYRFGYCGGPISSIFTRGGIFMFIFVILIIVLLVSLSKNNVFTTGFKTTTEESPLDILNKRYARGEVTKEQYEEIKKTIK